jgi:hypothetical protein
MLKAKGKVKALAATTGAFNIKRMSIPTVAGMLDKQSKHEEG